MPSKSMTSLFLSIGLLGLATLPGTGQEAPATPKAKVSPAVIEPQLAPADLTKLSKAFGEFFQANQIKEGIADATAGIDKVVEAIEKKLKGKRLLELIPDLERAMVLAHDLSDTVKKGKPETGSFTGAWKDTIQYAYHVPKSYRTKDGPYPLLLVIPEEGKDLAESLRLNWTDTTLLDSAIVAVVGMPTATAAWETLGSEGQAGGVASVIQMIRQLRGIYAIDHNRIFLAGHARGARSAVTIASYYPHVFAGVIARSGDLGDTTADNFGSTPVLLVGTAQNGSRFEQEAKDLEFTTVESKPSAELSEIWAWASTKTRIAHPTKVRFTPGILQGGSSFWLSVDGFSLASPHTVEASIDRENSVITITGGDFTKVDLLLNDRLIDLSRPFRVLINGVEHEAKLNPTLRFMLDTAIKSGDRARAYSCKGSFVFTGGKTATE